jgi:hypothetical protein
MDNVEAFHKNLGDMLLAARRCLELRQHLPALVLIYTLIDSLAWSAADRTQSSVRKRFEAWVSVWLLPHLAPRVADVTATDLYAARCAVLHTLTGDSDLSRAGEARRVLYAWGNADTQILRSAIDDAKLADHVAIHYDDLFTALWHAVDDFLETANHDPSLAARLDEAAGRHYVNIPADSTTDNGA